MHGYESGNLVPLTLLGRGGLLVVSVLYTFFFSHCFIFCRRDRTTIKEV